MNAKVVPFAPKKAEKKKAPDNYMFEGRAVCLACKHEWDTKSEAGRHELTCPECSATRGVFKGYYEPPHGTRIWTCGHCGSQIFHLTEGGASFCLGCGYHDRIIYE